MAKKQKIKKILVEQILDKYKINYESLALNLLDNSEEDNIEQLKNYDLSYDQVFKTLATKGDKTGPVIAVVPINQHLSLKKLAKVSQNKKVQMLPLKELQPTTGYVHGANNPVGIWHTKHFSIYLDNSAQNFDYISVSAGEIGRSIKINPNDLIKLVNGEFGDLLEE